MSDTVDKNKGEDKKPMRISSPGKLELKKTVGAGQVKQSFSHGRSKMVVVEKKKKRTYAPDSVGNMAEVGANAKGMASKVAEQEALDAFDNSDLTDKEKESRARALEGAAIKAKE
ncbi:MAG: translation initiation factor IF-2 associated domain-containing protein, partial [Rhodospirillaceae bacterium]|nr:translation initiation factor IF-2 associated domain-containing protein [Rhodospirillaceae bacterium]